MSKPAQKEDVLVVTRNRKAHHDYAIEDTVEAGMELTGSEVKSLRDCRANLSDSYAAPENGQVFLYKAHISPYEAASILGHVPDRKRRLLLNRREILKLEQRVAEKGYSLIPLDIHFRNGWAKVELGLARGKNTVDKRQDIKERESRREIDREMSRRVRGR